MKKLYSLILTALLGGAVSTAQVTIGETNYATLAEAITAATDGATLIVTQDINVDATVDLTGKSLTIQGEEGKNVKVNCSVTGGLNFNVKKNTTLKNLNLVYTAEATSNKTIIEVGGGKLTMEDCTVSNFKTSSNQGVFCFKTGGTGLLTNVIFTNNSVPAGRGEIFIGRVGTTISGTTNGSLYIEKALTITATNFSPETPVKVYVDATRGPGNLILGTTNPENFELHNTTLYLQVNGNNLQLVSEPTVVNGSIAYASLKDAVDKAKDNDVIKVLKDVSISNRINIQNANNLTVEAVDGVTISCTANNALAFLVQKTATLKNLNLVYTGNGNCSQALIEVSVDSQDKENVKKGNLIMENSSISDFKTSHNQGVFRVKGGAQATINNVNFTNNEVNYLENSVPVERGEIFVGQNSGVTVEGNTNGSIFLENKGSLTANNFAPEQPVKLYLGYTPTTDAVIVNGHTNPNDFAIQNSEINLVEKNGNLVVGGSSAIDDIAVDEENGEAVYYNLNGVVVNPDNLAPGLYLRRQGSKVTKVIVK